MPLRGTTTGYCYGVLLFVLALALPTHGRTTDLVHRGLAIEVASDRYPDRLCVGYYGTAVVAILLSTRFAE